MVALLFTDLVGSTEILVALGDDAGERLHRAYLDLLRACVSEWRGREVKSLGDGLMVAFPSALDALECAVAMQRSVERQNRSGGDAAAMLRVGVHAGEPLREEDDYFGTAVVVAKRLCDAAVGGQILVSELVRSVAAPRLTHPCLPVGRLALKGLDEPVAAYSLAWDGQDTRAPGRPRTAVAPTRRQGVLRSRLRSPRVPSEALPRSELVERVRAGIAGRLVAVVAGAGYGKSTVLAQALDGLPMPWIWLSCDARMAPADAFLAHLAEGIEERFPGVGAQLSGDGSAEAQTGELCNEILETIADDFAIVLDDLQALHGHSAITVIELLTRDLPQNVHLVLASRAALPFPLGRLRTAGVLELGERELALREGEGVELVMRARPAIDPGVAAQVHRTMEGWVAGLLLAAQSDVVLPAEASAPREHELHFDYLAEEVFARLPEDRRRFLHETSILDRFSPPLAEAVTGVADSGEIIDELVRSHLFTVRLERGGDWYRYHHLFQAFLRGRLEQEDGARLPVLHSRAAAWWEGAGDPVEAVPHLLAAGDAHAAVDVLEPLAEGMVASSQAELLTQWLEAIPEPLWSDRPGVILARASLLLRAAEHEASFADLEGLIVRLLDLGDHERAAAAVFRLQQSMLAAGAGAARRITAGRLLDRIDPNARLLPAARILLSTGYAYGARFEEAEEEIDRALRLPAAEGSQVLRHYAGVARAFYIEFFRGRPEVAIRDLEAAIAGLREREADDELAFLPFALTLRLYVLNELGRFEDNLRASVEAHEEYERRGLGRAAATRTRVWTRAMALVGLERWDEVASELALIIDVAGSAGTSYGYRLRALAARLAAARGDTQEVQAHVLASRPEMAAFGETCDAALFHCDFALAAHAVGLADLAREQADDAVATGRATGSPVGHARATLVAAHVWGPGPEGDALLAEALALTASWGLEALWTRRERPRAGRLLGRALVRGVGSPAEVEGLLVAAGGEMLADALEEAAGSPEVRARLAELMADARDIDIAVVDGLLRDATPAVREAARRTWGRLKASSRAAVAIESFGELRVLREGAPVPASAFGRQKARALLAALLAAWAPVHRETLCDWLWPELPPERAAAALRTTLHHLRRAIEPELDAGDPSSLVGTEGEAIVLRLGDRDAWDAARLGELAQPRDEAESVDEEVRRLTEAEALCGGPFLAEWPFEDWAAARRSELEDVQAAVLSRLAEALIEAGRPHDAISRYRHLLRLEPARERWHHALMRTYAQAGERSMALRQYHACRSRLRHEDGVEPGPEIRALYTELLRMEDAEVEPSGRSVTPA